MDPNKPNPSTLELLPQDLIGLIVQKVAADSPVDFINTLLSCKELGTTGTDKRVLRSLNLERFKRHPLEALNHSQMMTTWLSNGNNDANYIHGVLSYFHHGDKVTAMTHLSKAASAGHKEAIYLYALLLMGNGMIDKGKEYFRMLKFEEDIAAALAIWDQVNQTLDGIIVAEDDGYITAIQHLYIGVPCDIDNVDQCCPKCFYFKAMLKLILLT